MQFRLSVGGRRAEIIVLEVVERYVLCLDGEFVAVRLDFIDVSAKQGRAVQNGEQLPFVPSRIVSVSAPKGENGFLWHRGVRWKYRQFLKPGCVFGVFPRQHIRAGLQGTKHIFGSSTFQMELNRFPRGAAIR
jgi:hypothetical protein